MSRDYGRPLVSITYLRNCGFPYEPSYPANHRFISGEDHHQLSFGQPTLQIPDGKWSLVLAIILNTLLFGFPDRHQARIKSLWLDQLVNTRRWREHISETVEDLRQMMSSVC